MTNANTLEDAVVATERAVDLIDTDVHLAPKSVEELAAYLPAAVRDRLQSLRRLNAGREVYKPFVSANRLDARGTNGEPAGSDPVVVKQQLFGDAKVDFGLITPLMGQGPDPEFNAAVHSGLNRWQADTWLAEDQPRFFGSICASIDNIPAAVREIETWAQDPRFKQVLIHHDSDRPLGHPQYDLLWETAARHRLPVAMHFQESGRMAVGGTAVGPFDRYVDFHALSRPIDYAAHLVSWICAGTFSRIPDFRVAFLEGGFLWHRPLIARLAYAWARTSTHLQGAAKDPLRCVLEHVRFSSQPMETAPIDRDCAGLLQLADADTVLMFSSDYPHYDYDNPTRALPHGVSDEMRRRIMCENAREFYDLPLTRPLGPDDVTEVAA